MNYQKTKMKCLVRFDSITHHVQPPVSDSNTSNDCSLNYRLCNILNLSRSLHLLPLFIYFEIEGVCQTKAERPNLNLSSVYPKDEKTI